MTGPVMYVESEVRRDQVTCWITAAGHMQGFTFLGRGPFGSWVPGVPLGQIFDLGP